MPTDIFLSYAREDRARVQPIAKALAERGYDVWWDKGLRSGEDYRDRIEELLQTSRCVVVAWSRDSLESDFVMDEAGRAHRRKVLLPVFLDAGIDPPLGFGGIHTGDLSGWLENPDDPGFEQFMGDVDTVVGRKAAPAAPAARRTTPLRATGGGQQRTTHSVMPQMLRWGRNALIVLGLLFIAALFAPGEPVAETVDLEPAVAGAAVLDGTFRMTMLDGERLPLEGTEGDLLVSSSLEIRDAAGAARNGTGRWIEKVTTRDQAGSEATVGQESSFRMVSDTVHVPGLGGAAGFAYVYVIGADGVLTMTELDTKAVWTYVRL